MNNVMKLGMIQMLVSNDKQLSVEKAIKNIEMLANKGAQIIVLPEMFNCPYETNQFPIYAESHGDSTYKRMSEIAALKKIYLIAGSIPEVENDKIYNTSYIFGPQGQLIGKHRKLHMLDIDIENGQYFKESATLTAGDALTVIDTEFGKIGVALCYDIRFPELARAMVEQGAKILVYPASFNLTTGPAHWELLLRMRAVDNQVFVAGCSPARNYDAQYIAYGHSMVVNPWGDVIGELNEEEGFLIGTLHLEEVLTIREQLPLLKHLRKGIY